jgi:hypothetical protein
MRGAALQFILIYVVLCTVPLGLGIYLLFAPRRGGNFLNGSFAIFPQVQPVKLAREGKIPAVRLGGKLWRFRGTRWQ